CSPAFRFRTCSLYGALSSSNSASTPDDRDRGEWNSVIGCIVGTLALLQRQARTKPHGTSEPRRCFGCRAKNFQRISLVVTPVCALRSGLYGTCPGTFIGPRFHTSSPPIKR